MAYLFKNHFDLIGNHDEDLDHAPEFKTTIDGIVDNARTIVSVGWRPETGYQLYEHIGTYAKVIMLEAFESNVTSFTRTDLAKPMHGDILQLIHSIQDKQIDLLIWQDGPEHVTHEEFDKFLPKAKQVFKNIILATPNGHFPQGAYLGNIYETHKSSWFREDYTKRGFEVTEYLAPTKNSTNKTRGLIGYFAA